MRKSKTDPNYTDGCGRAAAILGVSRQLLLAAKKHGAPGFAGTRVFPEIVRDWLATEAGLAFVADLDDDIDRLKAERLREIVDGLRTKNRRDRGELISRASVFAGFVALAGRWTSIRQRFEAEAPARLAGKEADECRVVCRLLTEEIGAAMHDAGAVFAPLDQPES